MPGNHSLILQRLESRYANPTTALHFNSPYQLLIATILSAQCTDERVNLITDRLFADHPTVQAIAGLSEEIIAEYIRSAGLWRAKAKNIRAASIRLLKNFDGCVPRTRQELLTLPGVGRKTANVVLANAFGIPAIAVDTHVFRTAKRLGFSEGTTPDRVEQDLMHLIPQNKWAAAHHWLIYHGRSLCRARTPLCSDCFLADVCPWYSGGNQA